MNINFRSVFSLVFIVTILTYHNLPAQNEDKGRTEYLPTFEESRAALPVPVIESEPGWVKMYWFCWKEAFKKLKTPEPNSPFTSSFIDEAFAPQIFQWDTHFMIMFWKYAHHIFSSIKSHDNFYVCQEENGYICREIREADGKNYYFMGKENTINPPLFAWVEYEYFKMTGDNSRFDEVIQVLEKYMDWIGKNRRIESKHDLYWQTNLGSGMDNSPRSGSGWVDISAQMILSYKYMSEMARDINKNGKADEFQQKAEEVEERINKWMWNGNDGLYYDLADDGSQIKVKTAACFWPVLSMSASDEMTAKLVENLRDSSTFWRKVPFATLAANHEAYDPIDGYWLGSVWAPTNYMIIKGLENYGYNDFAYKASVRYLKGMDAVFKQTGTVWENYNPDEYVKSEYAKPDFVGWTGLGPISLLIESIIGIKADAENNLITWNINRTDRHGVEKLRMGETEISLIAEPRESKDDDLYVNIETSKDVNIRIFLNGVEREFQFEKGKSKIEVGM